ncbi:LysR family transcriptional regulator, partial [Pseudomonas aeruginosa]|uniref:LysR family transcriptional regulator n=1 Tax=Pseudomonas aeruginosa TaxID=287 RepID=UPI002674E7A0
MISLRQLHYFVEIVESGGFSRAAERLFVAQSALSRQVRELEDSIGPPLLRRGPRQVELTPAGRAFLPRAQRLLGDLEAARVERLGQVVVGAQFQALDAAALVALG